MVGFGGGEMRVAVFGLGEAGSLFAADLAAEGHRVLGYDPAGVVTPEGVDRVDDPAEAVSGADLVLALTSAADARGALVQALGAIPRSALYADLSTSGADLESELAAVAERAGLLFADVALMAVVPGRGLRTPALASGPGAQRYVELMAPMGVPVESIGGAAGDASTRKLLRSVMMKGLAALVIEAMRAAGEAGQAEWLWGNLTAQIEAADGALLRRLVEGTGLHSERRRHEMEASRDLLESLGVDPVMTRSTVESLRRVPTEGVPELPGD